MLPRVSRLLALLIAAVAPASAQEASYQIRPGDRITVDVFTAAGQRVAVVSGEHILDRDGTVYLPYVGDITVSGLDEVGLRDILSTRYGGFYDSPVVSVKVQLRVNVTGSVGRPGQYFLHPTATLVDAIASAGGTTPEYAVSTIQIPSDPTAVRLVRDGVTTVMNLRPDDIDPDVLGMRVRSGDWIHVPVQERSRVRDEITFWGSMVSFATSVVALIVLLGRS